MKLSVPAAISSVTADGLTFAAVGGVVTVPDNTPVATILRLVATPGITPYAPAQAADASSLAVTVAGATTARTLAAHAADTFNVLDFGLVADNATNNAPALTALLATAATAAAAQGGLVDVVFPATGIYGFASQVTIPAGVRLAGQGKPTLAAIGGSGRLFSITAGNCAMRNLRLDARNSVNTSPIDPVYISGASNVLLEDIELANPTGAIAVYASSGITIVRPVSAGSLTHGVYLNASYDCAVLNGSFQNLTYFGVILTNGCYRNLIEGNRTTSNGIELVGVTQDSYENRIIGNHAEGTGDNGISITGSKNVVVGNIAKGCQGNGIELYGERNLVVGNTCLNNARGNAGNTGWRAGIAVQPGFGGAGQWNVVCGNILDDEQATPTQLYGVWLGATTYGAWASGQAVTSGSYRYQGANLYKATTAGTTGATPPTWTTGTQSDGAVSWLFVRAFLTGLPSADYNEISSNMVRAFGTGRYLDASGGSHNEFIGGLVPVTLPSTLIASQISNPGGVAAISVPTGSYSYLNGSLPTVTIAAPSGGGQQATAIVAQMFMLGFGSIAAGGSGYAVNDVLSFVGGTPLSNGTPLQIRVTSIAGGGAITGFTNNGTGQFAYTALPPSGNTALSGGGGTGATLSGTSWHINAVSVTAPGSGYSSAPAITFSAGTGTPVSTATLAGSMTVNAGVGQILLDGTGTKLGLAGAAGAPVIMQGALIDGSGVRLTLGATYTVPANTSLVRFVQGTTVAASTVTLPTALSDGQPIQFSNYAGSITALTFSPAVLGWTNGSTLAAYTGLRVRWDSTASAWIREQ